MANQAMAMRDLVILIITIMALEDSIIKDLEDHLLEDSEGLQLEVLGAHRWDMVDIMLLISVIMEDIMEDMEGIMDIIDKYITYFIAGCK